ncbi:MAG: type I restriction endonuclease subunit R, partial [Candidatus Methylumidiphilus sp.]
NNPMPPSFITEAAVEQAALAWFRELGYAVLHGPDIAPDGAHSERACYKDVVLWGRLRAAIARLNPGLPAEQVEIVARCVVNPNSPGLLSANQQIHQRLVGGVPVDIRVGADTRGALARIIDFDHPHNNDWAVVNQFTIEGPRQTRRPDTLIFLNGLPLGNLEIKNLADENADIWAAWRQIQTYKTDIPDLYQFNAVCVVSDGADARLGSLTADTERFMKWRTIDGVTLDPLGRFAGLETLIRGVFKPEVFLDYLRYFVLFEDGEETVKKIANYHQFHAVRLAVRRIIAASTIAGDGKGGVVWHTQGSGKSVSMVCLAAKIMRASAMANPTLVVITDRNDLDGQLFGHFASAKSLLGETPRQVESRAELRQLLAGRPSGGIIFTTIQKFLVDKAEDIHPVLSDRHNVVVICDEAHRTQYGLDATMHRETGKIQYGYARHLRDALPNATFIAFTGTPVEQADRDTQQVFGEYVHVYDMRQAEEDGVVVPTYYESRLARLDLPPEAKPQLDAAIDELTEDEADQTSADMRRRWAELERIVGAQPRMAKIADDVVKHFSERAETLAGKGLIVGMSREICVRLYDAIIQLRPAWHSDDPRQGVIKVVMTGAATDAEHLQAHIYSKEVRKHLEKRFKNPDDPLQLVIVRDMWLTGFDVPCLHTLYVDKPMRAHNLMQAIARVNRVFKDKPGGLVVDYIGIAADLKNAIAQYASGGGRGKPAVDIAEAFAALLMHLDIARSLLDGFDRRLIKQNALAALSGAAEHILGLPTTDDGKEGKKRFADAVLAVGQAYALCRTYAEAEPLREEIAFLQAVKAILGKHDGADTKQDGRSKDAIVRQLLSQHLQASGVVDIFALAGLDKPDIGILSDEFLADVRKMKQRNLAVELLQRLIAGEIRSRFATNIVQLKKYSDLLEHALNRYRNRGVETAQVIEELIALAKDIHTALRRGEALRL